MLLIKCVDSPKHVLALRSSIYINTHTHLVHYGDQRVLIVALNLEAKLSNPTRGKYRGAQKHRAAFLLWVFRGLPAVQVTNVRCVGGRGLGSVVRRLGLMSGPHLCCFQSTGTR